MVVVGVIPASFFPSLSLCLELHKINSPVAPCTVSILLEWNFTVSNWGGLVFWFLVNHERKKQTPWRSVKTKARTSQPLPFPAGSLRDLGADCRESPISEASRPLLACICLARGIFGRCCYSVLSTELLSVPRTFI